MENTNKVNWWKIVGIIIAIIFLFVSGIYVGKKTTNSKIIEKIEYIELPPIHDTIPPIIIKESVDTLKLIKQCIKKGIYQELFPEKVIYVTDTIEFDKTDSTKIMNDWATLRDYEATLFEVDTLGKCDIKTSVQYNRISNIEYYFTPKQKQVTKTEIFKRKYLPYIGGGISTQPSVGVECGLFINQSWGFAIDANYNFNPNKIEGLPKYDMGIKILKMF